jgi:hypothetical protein
MRVSSMMLIAGCTVMTVGGLALTPTTALANQQRQPWHFRIQTVTESTNKVLSIKNADGKIERHETSGQWLGVDVQIRNVSGTMRSGADINLAGTVIVDTQGRGYRVSPEVSPVVYTGTIINPVNSGAGETVRLYFNLPPQGMWRKELRMDADGGPYVVKF